MLQGFDLCGMYADLQVMEGKLKALLAEMAADKAAAAAAESAGASCDSTRLHEAAASSGGIASQAATVYLRERSLGLLCYAVAGKQHTTCSQGSVHMVCSCICTNLVWCATAH
jgi:hypothetical protein